jgi:hypothetical protein
LQSEVDGTLVKPFGDSPYGYLVYTPDGHVLIQFAARERPKLFGRGQPVPEPVLLETTEAGTALGYVGYCGTFEIRDGQAIHCREFDIRANLDGSVEARSVVLDGDRLILGTPRGQQLEWQRVNPEEQPR